MIKRVLYLFLLFVGQLLLAQDGQQIQSTYSPFVQDGISVEGGNPQEMGFTPPGTPGIGFGGVAPGTKVVPIDMYFPILLALAVILIVGFAYYQKNKKARIS